MKITIHELHNFLTTKLPDEVLNDYINYRVLNERELGRVVTNALVRFLRGDEDPNRLTVTNELPMQPSRTYPDVIIRKRGKPWVIVELKECKQMKQNIFERECSKIRLQHEKNGTVRDYLVYVARRGKHPVKKVKGQFGYWFHEIPITLERNAGMTLSEVVEWEKVFKIRNRFVCEAAAGD